MKVIYNTPDALRVFGYFRDNGYVFKRRAVKAFVLSYEDDTKSPAAKDDAMRMLSYENISKRRHESWCEIVLEFIELRSQAGDEEFKKLVNAE